MKTRCKFRLVGENKHANGPSEYVFRTEYSQDIPEDQAFTKFTPSGELKVVIDNPAVTQSLKLGSCYYLDITEA